MSKIACISDDNIKTIFESFGIDTFVPSKDNDVKTIFEDLAKRNYSIIYILEKFAHTAMDIIDNMRKEHSTSIVVIADHISDLNLGLELIKRASVDAIGTDTIFINGANK